MVSINKKYLVLGSILVLLSACADFENNVSQDTFSKDIKNESAGGSNDDNDPFETVNRAVFSFNKSLDTFFLRPLALIYRDTVPGQDVIGNIVSNIKEPVTLANNLLQGKGDEASKTTARFFLNSTLGMGGIFDVAKEVELPGHKQDFGLTLGAWGGDIGPYLVVPFLGPSSPRDLLGSGVDVFLGPFNYLFYNTKLSNEPYFSRGIDLVDQRSDLVDVSDELEKESIDFYATIRSIYFQKRQGAAAGNLETELDVYEEELFDFKSNN